MNKIVVLTILLVILSGCTLGEENRETEEKIILERFGMYTLQEYSFQRVIITNDSISFETFNPNMTSTGYVNNSIDSEDFNELVSNFENFNQLDSVYNSEVNIADIGAGNITYVNGSSNYTVLVDPYTSRENPSEIGRIVDTLNYFISENINFSREEE